MKLTTALVIGSLLTACGKKASDSPLASGAPPTPVVVAVDAPPAPPPAADAAIAVPAPSTSVCDNPDALTAFLAKAWKVAPDALDPVRHCVAGHFPAAGIAVFAHMGTSDAEAISRLEVLDAAGASIARNEGEADKQRFDSLDALSHLQAIDLDGDGTDELIATETSSYKLSPTTEGVVVYAIKAGKLAPLLSRDYAYTTAEDGEGNEGTVLCTGNVAIAGTPPTLTITGSLAVPAATIAKEKADCVDGVEVYAMKGGALVKR